MNMSIFTSVTCARPLPPANGFYDQVYPDELFPGQYVTFRCNDDHRLSGAATLVCRTSGRWSARVPICQSGNFD